MFYSVFSNIPETKVFSTKDSLINFDEADSQNKISKTKSKEDLSQYGSMKNEIAEKFEVSTKEKNVVLRRTPNTFAEDFVGLEEGSIPQSLVVAAVVGVVCGISANIYYRVLEWGLNFFWKTLPKQIIIPSWSEWAYPLWIPIVGIFMAINLGLSVKYLGDPGDLPTTVKAIHEKGFLGMDHCLPMVVSSLFSIIGGSSVGPEAPLVAICACLAGFISRRIFHQTERNIIRKHTLMGMAGALSALFGAPLGGSLFALEINSRLGIEYFEHAVEAIFCGEITLAVFRQSANLSIGPIWEMTNKAVGPTDAFHILLGAILGLFGAAIAFCFAKIHKELLGLFRKWDLIDNRNSLKRALLAAIGILSIGLFVPQTMFWGENEFQVISTLGPVEKLPYVWPTTGLIDFQMDTAFKCFLVGILKIITISISVAGGYRGGFIFPFFMAGAAFGRSLLFFFPALSAPYACLCIAAGINVAITRTSLATPVLLAYLSGQQNILSGVLMASLTSLFATSYMVSFFKKMFFKYANKLTLHIERTVTRF